MIGRKHFFPLFVIFLLFLSGCATQRVKYADSKGEPDRQEGKEVVHTFYLMGDAGLSPSGEMNAALKIFKDKLNDAGKNSTAIFLGDNIYPKGFSDPKRSPEAYQSAKNHIDAQLRALQGFKGKSLFIPGNHDWYAEGLIGLKRQQEYVQDQLKDKDAFLPKSGCPIETIEVNDEVAVIVVDTQWYLTNWNKQPGINDKCDIKSREKFFLELEDEIKGHRQKTTIIAMHHSMFTYGQHGGQFSAKRQFYPDGKIGPLPFLGTFINVLRTTSGASNADLQHKRYRELKNRIVTLAQFSEKVIITSGHEHSLQYIFEDNTPQIVSGSGAKTGSTRLLNGSRFSTGDMGYAVLDVHKDGSSYVRFYGLGGNSEEVFLFGSEVLPPDDNGDTEVYQDVFPSRVAASIYSEEEIDKGKVFKTIWGERYRKYYGTKVSAPTVRLDTLFGGLTPVRKGGGHQSKSLRLRHKSGKEYVMRALRKRSELYLQSMAFQEQFVMDDLQDTYTLELLQDFYTGSHPYAPFTLGPLSDAIGIFHTNPVLYFVPKQKALKNFNAEFGDELYMIEEHAGDGHGDLESFGYSDQLKSTDGMLEDLRDDEKYSVDAEMYLRARLFDMVLGDWDRHVDQWRWVEFKDNETGKIVYKPMPRDRDQVFSNMGDGLLMQLATRLVPALKLMEGFNEEIRSVKGFNSSPKTYVLDMALLTETTKSQWLDQAKYIQKHLTVEVIDKAFEAFPNEVRGATIDNIREILLKRIATIDKTAKEYYGLLNKYAVVTGTDKDDWVEVHRLDNSSTEVKVYRNIKGEKSKLFFSKVFEMADTREIWIYGLDDDDRFVVTGPAKRGIKVRLIGGQNNDTYEIKNGNRLVVYDYKSKKNTFKNNDGAKVKLTDNYEVNTYRPLQLRNSVNQMLPMIGYNPDDGIKIGVVNTYTFNGFRQNPFTQKHSVGAAYFFATSGFDFTYSGEFAHLFENWNLGLEGRFTSPNFTANFFGFGNETENPDDTFDMDYNRVRLRTVKLAPALVWRGQLGAEFKTGISYEIIDVEETENRFINTFYLQNGEESRERFFGVDATYSYENADNVAFPTLGMATDLKLGYRRNVGSSGQDFGYVVPSLSLTHKLLPNGRLVLATKWKAHFTLGDGYEFYQAANIGGIDGLRGYRNQRFTGKKSYYQNTDIRYSLSKRRTGILPMAMGIYGGFDYGRVWIPSEDSGQWHTSYGGGFFLNTADIISARAALFYSEDGPRFSFGLGFGF